uniref:Elongation factor G, mitochondrial n=1 Tax=Anthurium amnicola TaxID=1678845 RepID=A0A1D1ZJZ8_9ARAE
MEAPQFRFRSGGRWRKRAPGRPVLLSGSLICASLFLFFLLSYLKILWPLSSPSSSVGITSPAHFPQCGGGSERLAASIGSQERFLWYAPHSGFSNQLAELKNAVLFAAILNRTLVVPPVLDHHAVVLGSCPKFRVADPSDLRASVWDHIMDLLRRRRYVSMGDIVDLPSVVSSSMVRLIDFRVFVSTWCGIDIDVTCSGSEAESLPRNLHQCKALLSGLQGNVDNCVYAVEDDCRMTVWTYGQDDDGILDIFQPDKELQKKKKFSYIRRRRDVYKALGPGSEAEMATVLAFGSLFSSPYKGSELYIDIHQVPVNSRIQSLLQSIEYLPFVREILDAGRDFALNKIKEPFLCAQLRLLDGQFKNHWKGTFSTLRQKIELLQAELKGKKTQGPIHIFIMTDLPSANWTGSYLAELMSNSDSFKIYSLHERDEPVIQASIKLMAAKHGLGTSFLPSKPSIRMKNRSCAPLILPDIVLYVEETVCSCASLGFVGTSGSSIAASIELMKRNNICNAATH